MTDTDDTAVSRTRPVLLGLLALLSLACIVSGGFFYVWIIADYLQDGTPFTGLQMLGWVFGLFSAGVISVGLLLTGILLRLISWPRASLGLAVVAVAFLIATYVVFSDIDKAQGHTELLILQGACFLYPFLIALPPFLHWLKARPGP